MTFSIYTYELEAGRYFTFGEFASYEAAFDAAILCLPHGRWYVREDRTTTLFRIEFRKPDHNPKPLAIVRDAGGIPDYRQLRDALPARYRVPFDRTHWMRPDSTGFVMCVLFGTRGRVLGSIWATPYQFQA